MEENKKLNDWWKIVALILIGLVIGIVAGAKFITGVDWFLDKQSTCSLPQINKTGLDCEVFWCNMVQGGNYSLEKEICIFATTVNQTVYVNITTNETNQTRDEFNITMLEIALGVNLSNGNFYNQIMNASVNYTNQQNAELQKNITSKLPDYFNEEPKEEIKSSTWVIIILVAVLIVVIVLLIIRFTKQDTACVSAYGRQVNKKIQPINELSNEEKIRQLEEQLKKSKQPAQPKKENLSEVESEFVGEYEEEDIE